MITTAKFRSLYSRFTFVENTISNSPKAMRVKFLWSDRLFCFSSICKFGSFKNPFATITSRPELYFRFWWSIVSTNEKNDFYKLWQQHKLLKTIEISEVWSDTYREIYIYINSYLNPLTKFTSNSRSTEFKDILPWDISQIIRKTIPISTRKS